MGSKIGIILAFLLSIASAGGSYYLYQKWVEERNLRGSVEAEKDQLREKVITVQSERQQFKHESEQLKVQNDEYRAKAQAVQEQVEKLIAEQNKNNLERSNLEKAIKGHQELITNLQQKVQELDQKAKEAQQACLAGPVDMKAPSFTAPSASETTATTAGTAPVKQAEPIAGAPAAPPEPPAVAAPAVTGSKILTVNRKFNFVVINLGLQDGLKMGDKLKVVKQGKDSATLQVEKLYDKFSAATILEENSQGHVAEGDEVQRV